MVLVDGEAEDKLTNQRQLKLDLNHPIGQFTFRFTVNKYYHLVAFFSATVSLNG